MKKVTIQDIADALGVSRNTVSKAINNSEGLADATREKILQKAVEMGYKHFSYVAMHTRGLGQTAEDAKTTPKSPAVITLLTGNIWAHTNHFAMLMLDRFKQELVQFGYTLNTCFVDRDDIARRALPASFQKEQTAGIVCIEIFDHAYADMICSLGLPTLFVDGPHKRSGYALAADQLYMDNTTGITQLVNDMLAKGKKKIGFIGDYEHCQSFFERYTAYRCAMLLAGVPVNENFIIKANENYEQPLFALSQMPDLFICGNDFLAGDVQKVLNKMGKSVPEDVLLSGFDDAPESRVFTPTLTTVHIHTQVMAYAACSLLLSRIEEPALDYRTMYTETELIYRDSTNL